MMGVSPRFSRLMRRYSLTLEPYLFKGTQRPEDHACIVKAHKDAKGMLCGYVEGLEGTVTWRPITTAPRDATAVLIMQNDWPGCPDGVADKCSSINTYVAAWCTNDDDDGDDGAGGAWVCYMDAICDTKAPIEPTHWMPLPNPPGRSPGKQT